MAMSLTLLTAVKGTLDAGPAIHPYAVGAIALVILLAMLVSLLSFGRGRDHS